MYTIRTLPADSPHMWQSFMLTQELSPPCATAVTDGALELPVVAMGGIGGRSGSSLSVRDSLPPVVYIVDAIILNSCSVRSVGSEFQSHARRHCSAAIASDAVNLFKQ
jgi:hypothetical protein